MNTRALARKAAKLQPTDEQRRMAHDIALVFHNTTHTEHVRSAAAVEQSMHILDDGEFEKWVTLGNAIAAHLGHNRGTDPDTNESDIINQIADDTSSYWVALEFAKIAITDPNAYEIEQAAIAAKDMNAAGYTDVDAALTDLEVTFEAADNIAAEQYIRMGFEWIEHTVEPKNPVAFGDCERFAADIIEQALKQATK